LLLLAPSKISEKLDEMYKPTRRSQAAPGHEGSSDLVQLPDTAPDELNVSEADASQKPVVRLGHDLSEGISHAPAISTWSRKGGVAVRYRMTACCARS